MATAKKIATLEEKLRAQDKRLQRKYGITLEERDNRARQQNHNCKICRGSLVAYGHACVDHFHFPIDVCRVDEMDAAPAGMKWIARVYNERKHLHAVAFGITKTGARAEVKKMCGPWSVRGLLCFKCNYAIGVIEKFFDAARHPEHLLPVIEYFRARL